MRDASLGFVETVGTAGIILSDKTSEVLARLGGGAGESIANFANEATPTELRESANRLWVEGTDITLEGFATGTRLLYITIAGVVGVSLYMRLRD